MLRPNSNYKILLQDCGPDAQYCFTEIESDWMLTGQQTWRVIRGCATKVRHFLNACVSVLYKKSIALLFIYFTLIWLHPALNIL